MDVCFRATKFVIELLKEETVETTEVMLDNDKFGYMNLTIFLGLLVSHWRESNEDKVLLEGMVLVFLGSQG